MSDFPTQLSEQAVLNRVFDSSTNSLRLESGAASGTSGTPVQIASSATNVTLQAANTSRKEVIIYNDSTANLYVKFGATASTTSYTVKLLPGDTMSDDTYSGKIDGIWDVANGNAYVTEVV